MAFESVSFARLCCCYGGLQFSRYSREISRIHSRYAPATSVLVFTPTAPVDSAATNTPTISAPDSAPAHSTIASEAHLAESLRLVPLDFAGTVLECFTYSVPGNANEESEWYMVPEGVALHEVFSLRTVQLKGLGIDVLELNPSIWSWQPGNQMETFFIGKGLLDRNYIIGNLVELGYEETSYRKTTYWGLDEDFTPATRPPLRGGLGLTLNRVAILDGMLLAAPASGIMEGLIATQEGAAPSLINSGAHRAIAEAAGEGFISGALMPAQWIVDNWNTRNTRSTDRLDRYKEEANRWENLKPYTLALFGYRLHQDTEEISVALYYPDPKAAAADAQVLEDRWNSFYYDPMGPLSESESEDVPATASCSPFSTTAIEGPGHSVLVGSCPVLRSEEYDLTVKGPVLWLWLFFTRELQFLVQDLDELG